MNINMNENRVSHQPVIALGLRPTQALLIDEIDAIQSHVMLLTHQWCTGLNQFRHCV